MRILKTSLLFILLISCNDQSNQDYYSDESQDVHRGTTHAPTVTDVNTDTGGVEVYGDTVSEGYFTSSNSIGSLQVDGLKADTISLKFNNYNQELAISEVRLYGDKGLLHYNSQHALKDNNPESSISIGSNSELIFNFDKQETLHKIELDLSFKNRDLVLFDLEVSNPMGTEEHLQFYKFNNYYLQLESSDTDTALFILTNKKCSNGEILFPNGMCQVAQKRCPFGETNSCYITVGGQRRDCVVAKSKSACEDHYNQTQVCKISKFYQFSQTEIIPVFYKSKVLNKVYCRLPAR